MYYGKLYVEKRYQFIAHNNPIHNNNYKINYASLLGSLSKFKYNPRATGTRAVGENLSGSSVLLSTVTLNLLSRAVKAVRNFNVPYLFPENK